MVIPWHTAQLHIPWVPTEGHRLVPRCSIWRDAKSSLLCYDKCSDFFCSFYLVPEAKLREKRLTTIHSKQLCAKKNLKKIAEFCLIVGMIHLCIPLPSIITTLGLILKDSQLFCNSLYSHKHRGGTERNQADHQLMIITGTQLLPLEKIQGKKNT